MKNELAFERILKRLSETAKERDALFEEISALEEKLKELRGNLIIDEKLLSESPLVPCIIGEILHLNGHTRDYKRLSRNKFLNKDTGNIFGCDARFWCGKVYMRIREDGSFTIEGKIEDMKQFIHNYGIALDTKDMDEQVQKAKSHLNECEKIRKEFK